jgi:hypothetical protein
MDLSDRQRRLAFVGVVIALAAVGVYLTLPGRGAPAGAPSANVSAAPSPTAGTAGPGGPAVTPSAVPSSPESSTFDIYSLLPFGEKDFAAAADVARRFTIAYGTYRYDEEPKVYLDRLQPLMTPDLRTEIERGVASPGLIEQRRQEQFVATGEATIDAIRDIEKSSVTFQVTAKQQITKTGRSSESSERYSITVGKDGGGWRVFAFQPADAGQAGDTG